MIPQIPKLDENYYEWVNLPVDRPLRLFENDFLELLTKVNNLKTVSENVILMPLSQWMKIS